MDGQAQERAGAGDHLGQDDGGRGVPSRAYDIAPSEIETWVDGGEKGMETALGANPQDVREQYELQLKELQEAYGEAMLELRARKKLQCVLGEDEK